jgi:hypothetical protein
LGLATDRNLAHHLSPAGMQRIPGGQPTRRSRVSKRLPAVSKVTREPAWMTSPTRIGLPIPGVATAAQLTSERTKVTEYWPVPVLWELTTPLP